MQGLIGGSIIGTIGMLLPETLFWAEYEAQSIIDKNVQRNIIHKNTAARKKSLLTMKVKALEGGAAAAAPVAAE